MFEKICVTNRHLSDNFLYDLRCVAKNKMVDKILLRELDLNENEYKKLTVEILKIIKDYNVKLILHSYFKVANELGINELHLPFQQFIKFDKSKFYGFIGASIHSLDEAFKAQNLGANYIVAGHIFDTPSHENKAGRGIEFLEEIVKNIQIPVYAIGGINTKNLELIQKSGASGAYMMRAILKLEEK